MRTSGETHMIKWSFTWFLFLLWLSIGLPWEWHWKIGIMLLLIWILWATPLVVAHKDADHVADLDFLWQLSGLTPMVVTYNAIRHSTYLEFLNDSYSSVIYWSGPVNNDWYHVNFWDDSWYWFGIMYECVRLIIEVRLNWSNHNLEIGIKDTCFFY